MYVLFIFIFCFFLFLLVIKLLLLELLNFFLGELMSKFAIFPNSHSCNTLASFCCQHSSAMFLTVEPLACVNFSIRPMKSALSLLHIIEKLAFILATIWPD